MISTISSLVLTTTLPTLANTTSTLSGSIHYNVTQPFHIFNNIGETSNNATIANVVENVVANVNGNVVNGTVLLSSASSSSLDNPFYNLTGNETTTYQQPVFPNYIRVTSMVFCIIIMCLGVIGNVMVPIVILKTKDMRNSTNIFLMNLSVADLMVLLVCTPTVLVEVNTKPETWVLGEEMCKAVPFVEFTVAHASVLTILAISFERYYAICEPLRAGYVCTKARASLICLLAWFFAAICTSPILVVAKYQFEEYYDGSMVPVCWTSADTFWKAFFFIITIFVFFFIPLAILIILYTMIAKTLMEHPSILCPPKSNQVPPHTAMKYRKQVTLMLGTVVLGFFICLLPFKAFTLCVIVFPPEMILSVGFEARYNILYFCKIMVHLNSAINPILYNLMSSKFREGFLRLCGFGKKRAKKLRKRDHFGRKNTFNNTSTSNSITNTTDSFWRRYSNRNTSQKSVTVHSTPIRVPNQVTSDILEDTEEELSSSIRNNNMKHSYVRVPFTSGGSQKRTIVQNGESFV